jgi:hypothetical protein
MMLNAIRDGVKREGRAFPVGMSRPLMDRFNEKYIPVTESGCWVWLGTVSSHGYGRILRTATRADYAHRISYELFRGPIPKGLQIDHLCRVRCCVNPDHLEVVTAETNKARGDSLNAINARKTHCEHGHPFDQRNTWERQLPGGKIGRQCRTCRYLAYRRWRDSHA